MKKCIALIIMQLLAVVSFAQSAIWSFQAHTAMSNLFIIIGLKGF